MQLGVAAGAALFEQRVTRLDHLGADRGLHRAVADVLPLAGPDALARGSGVGHARSSRSLDNWARRPGRFRARDARSQQYISDCVSPLHAGRPRIRKAQPLAGGRRAPRRRLARHRQRAGAGRLARPGRPQPWNSPTTDSVSLTVDGPAAAGVPTGDGNLTVRAAQRAARAGGPPARHAGLALARSSRTAPGSEAARRTPRPCCAPASPGSRAWVSPTDPERRGGGRARDRQRRPSAALAVGATRSRPRRPSRAARHPDAPPRDRIDDAEFDRRHVCGRCSRTRSATTAVRTALLSSSRPAGRPTPT